MSPKSVRLRTHECRRCPALQCVGCPRAFETDTITDQPIDEALAHRDLDMLAETARAKLADGEALTEEEKLSLLPPFLRGLIARSQKVQHSDPTAEARAIKFVTARAALTEAIREHGAGSAEHRAALASFLQAQRELHDPTRP